MATYATKVKPQTLWPQYFIFEIKEWEPSYSLSVNHDKFRETAYREHVGIDLDVTCVHPQTLVGRSVRFNLAGERNCLTPAILQREPDWKPLCVGLLEMPPSGGRFYTSVPHESIPMITTALAHRLFCYIQTYGPPLKRTRSLCSEFRFLKSVDLEEY